jgi:hypothetical protein
MRRLVTIGSGIGALVALAVMIAAIVTGTGDEGAGSTASVFPAGSLTVGLQDTRLSTGSPELIPARIALLAATGVTVTRVDVRWLEIASRKPARGADPSDPAYAWDRLDAVIDGLAAKGIQAVVDVSGTPSWANGGRGPEWAPDVDDYGAFMRALATRYDGTTHAAVRLYEPWDAPNDPLSLMPQWNSATGQATPASPALYSALLARAYSEVKVAAPDAEVVGLAVAPIETSAPPSGGVSVLDFVQGMVPSKPPMDAVSVHIAPTGPPNAASEAVPSLGSLPRLSRELDRLAPGAPIYVTQLGYRTGPGGLSEADQAAYLPQALQRLATAADIRLVIWDLLQDSPDRTSGLLRVDGSRKPAWAAFAAGPKVLPSRSGP